MEYVSIKRIHRCDYCHIIISKSSWCNGCSYFEDAWKNRIRESQNAYCCIYEEKPMKDCKGAKFDDETGRYKCWLEGNFSNVTEWSKCKYKTPNKFYKER